MNEVTTQDNTEVAKYDPQLVETLRSSLFPGAKIESVMMALEYCKAAKLDIMLKPVHIVPMNVKDAKTGKYEYRDIIMPGINLYRIQASRSGCAGISEPEFGEDVTQSLGGVDVVYPQWCKITVKRIIAGRVTEFSAKEFWKENYATAGKDAKNPNAMWLKRPYGQLAKCAEAQALRKAFPEVGAMPTAEEMEGKHIDSDEYEDIKKKAPVSATARLKEKLGMTEANDLIDVNPDTGEITEPVAELLPTVENLTFLMETATTQAELIELAQQAMQLPEKEKLLMRTVYKKCDAALKAV